MYDPSSKTIQELERDLISFAIEAEKAGLAWADADAVKEQFEDLKKVVLAHNMPKDGSMSLREHEGLLSEEYRIHLEGLYRARKKANEAKVKYVSAQAKLDALRTILSNKREMFKRGVEAA